jgi:Uma2 family endonuclease
VPPTWSWKSGRLAPGSGTRTIKRRLYERFAVAEYWVIDPELDTIKVYRRSGETYARAAELMLEQNDRLSTPLLPGLHMPLAEIFRD